METSLFKQYDAGGRVDLLDDDDGHIATGLVANGPAPLC